MSTDFIKINTLKVSQNGGQHRGMFVGKMKFTDLQDIYRLTERKENNTDPFENAMVRSKTEMINLFAGYEEEFQRHLNINKLKEIKSFIIEELAKDSDNPLFPTSLILSFQLNDDNELIEDEHEIAELEKKDSDGVYLCRKEDKNDFQTILIPRKERICLIVDGQHRFSGIRKFYSEILHDEATKNKIEKFEFITTFLIGYDVFEIAQVFANVNFTQKPVNKSLYYDIFGSPASDKSDIQLAHYLTLHLNNNIDSPLKDMVKLLGRGEGLFSQAFLVEKLLIHFGKNGVWYTLYENYKNDGEEYLAIPVFLKLYFTQISISFKEAWPIGKDNGYGKLIFSSKHYDYILCKTTGMGALMRLIKDFYPISKDKDNETLTEYLKGCFSKISKPNIHRLFHKDGDYGKGGSEGFQIRLYKELRDIFFS